MRRSGFTVEQTSLRPYLVFSLIVHVVLFAVITVGILGEGRKVEVQEELFIAEVEKEERRQEEEARKLREEAAADLLSRQALAEMAQLVEDQLQQRDEDQLLKLTAEDVKEQVAEWDAARELDALLNEEFYDLSDQLRNLAFEDLRGNLKEMKQDLLLSQVRSFIRTRVAPEIKQRIDDRLKQELGEQIKREAERQSQAEKSSRLAEAKKALDTAVGQLAQAKARQDAATRHVERSQTDAAVTAEQDAARGHEAAAESIDQALEAVERAAPAVAQEAQALRETEASRNIKPAVSEATAAIDKARQSHAAAAQVDRRKEPERRKAADAQASSDGKEAAARTGEAAQTMTARIKELQGLSSKIAAEQKNRAFDDLQRKVVEEATAEVEQAVRERVEKEVAETAVPTAAGRIVQALDAELKKRNLDDAKFREFLEKDIRRALQEEMNRRKPDPELALEKTERHFELSDNASLEEARKDVAEAARKLEELSRKQTALRDVVPEDTPSTDAMKQHVMAQEVRDTRDEAQRALSKARKATLLNDSKVAEAESLVRDPVVEKTAVEAAKAMEREVVVDAKKMMTDVAARIDASAQAMRRLEQELAGEASSVRKRAAEHVDLAKALGETKAREAVNKVVEQAEKVAEQRVKPEVAWAATTVDVRGVAGDEDQAEAMGRMTELESRLNQIAENVAQGRALADLLGLGILGPGQGLRPGGLPSQENLKWTLPYGRAMSRINLKAYEEFVKDMRDRLNPDNYYGPEDAPADELTTTAHAVEQTPPAVIFVDDIRKPDAADETEAETKREVPRPEFETLEFGAAAMMESPIQIDGDLSDWGELRHGLKLRYVGDSLDKVDDGPTVIVRWSPDGLYFGYTVDDPNGIQPCPDYSWSGDCLEVMVDMANSRRAEAFMNVDSQKFQLTPFGAKGQMNLRVWEMGRGLRGLRMAVGYPDVEGVKGHTAATQHDGGYTVEGFISRRALSRPLLVPGRYIGLNFSLNRGQGAPTYQWSASQQLQSWRRPDTWGDLLLLGSDARLRFLKHDSQEPLEAIVPNDVVGLEVRDPDMNINTRKIDRVPAQLRTKGGAASMFVVLAETGPSTGVFHASVNTQPYFMEAKENALNVRSGTTIELLYTDARSEFGERDRQLTAELPVGWPVLTLGSN